MSTVILQAINKTEWDLSNDIHKQSASYPYWQRVDAWTDNLMNRLVDQGEGLPLFVPITATFKPASIRENEVLAEFSRFYARLTRLLIKNPERSSKRRLLPFTVAWRDDPSTRPDKYQSRPSLSNHPSLASHVHALTIIHPSVTQPFLDIAGELESTWQGIPIGSSHPYPNPSVEIGMPRHRNRTLHADISRAEEIKCLMRNELAGDFDTVRNKVRACVAYSSKLECRFASGDIADCFTVLPATRTEKRR